MILRSRHNFKVRIIPVTLRALVVIVLLEACGTLEELIAMITQSTANYKALLKEFDEDDIKSGLFVQGRMGKKHFKPGIIIGVKGFVVSTMGPSTIKEILQCSRPRKSYVIHQF